MNELAQKIAQLIDTLNKGANGIGDAAKMYAPELWRLTLRQVIIDAWTTWAIFAVLSAVGMFFSIWLLRASILLNKNKSYGELCSDYATGRNWSYVLISVITTVFVVATSHLVSVVLNPEFAAASYLASRVLNK